MSSAIVRNSVRVVKTQLNSGGPAVTCIDLTPARARIARLLEVSTLQIHRVPLDVAKRATPITYDASQMASMLYMLMHQYDGSGMAYDKEAVQAVTHSLTETMTEVKPVAQDGRYARRLAVD
jgi:hypothetical protein